VFLRTRGYVLIDRKYFALGSLLKGAASVAAVAPRWTHAPHHPPPTSPPPTLLQPQLADLPLADIVQHQQARSHHQRIHCAQAHSYNHREPGQQGYGNTLHSTHTTLTQSRGTSHRATGALDNFSTWFHRVYRSMEGWRTACICIPFSLKRRSIVVGVETGQIDVAVLYNGFQPIR
jgi:hypothetical protein